MYKHLFFTVLKAVSTYSTSPCSNFLLCLVKIQEGDKSLNNFECPGCAQKKGGQYTHGKIDMDALKERGVSAAAVAPAEASPQGEEEAGGDDPASNTCTWPPPEAEYFFGEQTLKSSVSQFLAIPLRVEARLSWRDRIASPGHVISLTRLSPLS